MFLPKKTRSRFLELTCALSFCPQRFCNSVMADHLQAERLFNRASYSSGDRSYSSANNEPRSSSMPTEGSGGGVITNRVTEPPAQMTPRDSNSGGVVPASGINPATQARLGGMHYQRSSSDNLDRPLDKPSSGNSGSVVPAKETPEELFRYGEPDNVEIAEEHRDYAGPEYHYTNWWFSTRERLKPYFAEFLGTLILILWGEVRRFLLVVRSECAELTFALRAPKHKSLQLVINQMIIYQSHLAGELASCECFRGSEVFYGLSGLVYGPLRACLRS